MPDPALAAAPPQVSSKCAEREAEEEDRRQTRQAKPAGAASVSPEEPPLVHEVLRGPSRLLDDAARAYFESRFRHNFSAVRVHTDTRAAQSARAAGAIAYSVGPHIAFDTGRYAPESASGRYLIAHELAHVVQQAATARIPSRLDITSPGDRAELAAENAAAQTMRGAAEPLAAEPIRIHRQTPGPGPAPPAAARIVMPDTNFFLDIGRGSAAAAETLRKLSKDPNVRVIMPRSIYAELTRITEHSTAEEVAAYKVMIEKFKVKVVDEPMEQREGTYVRFAEDPKGQFGPQGAAGLSTKARKTLSDVTHIAQAKDSGAEILTLDDKAQKNAKALGVDVAPESHGLKSPGGATSAKNITRVMPEITPADLAHAMSTKVPGGGGSGGPAGGGTPPPAGGAPGGPGEGGGGPGAAAGAVDTPQGAMKPGSTETPGPDTGERPRIPGGGTGEAAPPGFTKTMGFAVLNIGAGITAGLLQDAFHDQVIEDLGNMPKPTVDRRGAAEFLNDPATGTAVGLLDVLGKDLKPFTAQLQDQHRKIIAGQQFAFLAAALIPDKSQADMELRFSRLDAISEELAAYDEQLTVAQQNLAAILDQEKKAQQAKQAADQLIDALPKLFTGQVVGFETVGVGQIPNIQDFSDLDSGLRSFSVSVDTAFTDAHAAKTAVDQALGEERNLRDQVRKAWFDEFALQLAQLVKQRAAQPAPAAATPAPAPQVRGLTTMLNSDQQGILAMLRTKVSELLYELQQNENKVSAAGDKGDDALFKERQDLLDRYKTAKGELDAFKQKFNLTDED